MNRGIFRIVPALLLLAAVTPARAGNPDRLADRFSASPEPSASPATSRSDADPVIMDARIGKRAGRTRFVVEVSDPVKVRVFTLADPDRVVIDMPEVLWRVRDAGQPSGAIKDYRFGLFRPGNSRFVIDLARPASLAEPLVLPPEDGHGYRIVVDLLPASHEDFARRSGWPANLQSSDAASVDAVDAARTPGGAMHTTKRVIVVDAGHGGIDSGTRGYDGQLEKALVLDEALRLGKVLERRGYAVHLTRTSDVYVPLRDRVNAARAYGADLFISLHADSNPDPKVFGASVYTLSEAASDAEAAALARKENQSDVVAGVDLAGENSPVASILIGLAQRDTINRSVHFADALVPDLAHATDILPRAPRRSAGFVVLKAPDVPAVLIELGYLSNPGDCARMRMEDWRDRIASAIADAVDRQFRQGAREALSAQAAK